jgi:Fic family protein
MIYNWQQLDWPEFKYELGEVEELLSAFTEESGRTSGMLNAMSEGQQMETAISTMVIEAIKTSEIEGEYLNRQDVVSSIRNNLGLNKNPDIIKDKKAQGVGKVMVEVREQSADPLTEQNLFHWHTLLMADARHIQIGEWRTHEDPMQVVSGPLGRQKIHFEAPPSEQVPKEMKAFIKWFNDTAPGQKNEIKKAPIRSAIAHLYFESIHPFEDGNGRIGRAIAEKALSQTIGRPVLLSLSGTIDNDRNAYYQALEKASKSNEITKWINYFAGTVYRAQKQTNLLIDFTLKKTLFFDRFNNQLNERHLKVIKRMMDAGPDGFQGGMNANKYLSLTKISKATATRDLQYLSEIKVLIAEGGGRSTRYILNMDIAK